MVAVVQLAITLGATVGGFVYDAVGSAPEFLGSAAILVAAALAAFFAGAKYAQPTPQSLIAGSAKKRPS